MPDLARFLHPPDREAESDGGRGEAEVRLAIYDSPLATPRVITLRGEEFHQFVGELAARTYHHSRERGGRIPYVVIREIVENLIHAYFEGAVISILDDGNTIRISDQGPGVADPEKALLPGYTTATAEMRRYIKGVGSGLPVAKEQLAFLGGALRIDSNLSRGTVVTLSVGPASPPQTAAAVTSPPDPASTRPPELTPRQKKVLLLIAEMGSAGPSAVAKELGVSQSTAYRELQALSALRLIHSRRSGKRTLTEDGIAVLGTVFKS
ncbi:MAG: ATP-binding protein [Armatimonadota bacterium]|nr:ATP-binding protein [Armatimonadota bacterium]MDR7451081.1 ATP-binding protein [Armatimonadota bacterium]MDR7465898.1 ATP-binding protein [Armatimonadota bacterium]MDR7493963.1 ATP-binding protein [Armatimonadota bacterium]MDR7498413.1 ATP-binding protein [Armatimonadota bacterium]